MKTAIDATHAGHWSRLFGAITLLCLLCLLCACSTHPLGMDDEEWQQLSPEQRLQAREKQSELDRLAEQRRVAEAAARRDEAQRQMVELDVRRREARYGERLQCVLQPAQAWFNREWRPVEPLALDLVVGHEQMLTLRETERRTLHYSSRVHARFDGQQLTLCQHAHDQRNPGICVRELGTMVDYQRGVRRTVLADQFLRGQLRCNLVP